MVELYGRRSPQSESQMKKICILGSTGSIGKNTLRVISHLKEGVEVIALAAKSQIDLLEEQAALFHPKLIAVFDEDKALELQKRVPHIEVVAGVEGLIQASTLSEVNFVVSAMTGTVGILPTLRAIEQGKTVALANKEVLVSAGEICMRTAQKKGVNILPIDSEHSAIFQCLQNSSSKEVQRLILTASGGPFLRFSEEELTSVTPEQALCHPTWQMGPKVTIDSSTLMNKGLEVIEAHYLFGIPLDRIEVVIHPQSVIHSMVEMVDGSMLAQMSEPSMIIPIQYALTYPHRAPGLLQPFDFTRARSLEFFPVDNARFGCLKLAYQAVIEGGTTPSYLNAANEILVERFLQREIGWQEIPHRLEQLLARYPSEKESSVEAVLAADSLGREHAAHFND